MVGVACLRGQREPCCLQTEQLEARGRSLPPRRNGTGGSERTVSESCPGGRSPQEGALSSVVLSPQLTHQESAFFFSDDVSPFSVVDVKLKGSWCVRTAPSVCPAVGYAASFNAVLL